MRVRLKKESDSSGLLGVKIIWDELTRKIYMKIELVGRVIQALSLDTGNDKGKCTQSEARYLVKYEDGKTEK